MKKMLYFGEKKRIGMALPLTLVVLVVAGAMVAVAMYFIENMMSTTQMKLDNEMRMNAALAGVEKGKQWVLEEIAKPAATSELKPSPVISIDVTGDFDDLIIKSFSDTVGDIPVETDIFFLLYTASDDVEFVKGMPPMVSISSTSGEGSGSTSEVQRQSYDASNRGGGSPEGFGEDSSPIYRAYLIRSSAEMNGIRKTLEQAVYMKQ